MSAKFKNIFKLQLVQLLFTIIIPMLLASCGKNSLTENVLKSEAVQNSANDQYYQGHWKSETVLINQVGPFEEQIYDHQSWKMKRSNQIEFNQATKLNNVPDCDLLDQVKFSYAHVALFSYFNQANYTLFAVITIPKQDQVKQQLACAVEIGRGEYQTTQNFATLMDIDLSFVAEHKANQQFLLRFLR